MKDGLTEEKEARRILDRQLKLGEGPVWDSAEKVLYYVDIEGKSIGCYNPRTREHTFLETEKMPGCIVSNCRGSLVAAEQDRLVEVNPKTGKRCVLDRLELPEGLRFNDGKCDCRGRLWVGIMAIDQDAPYAKGCGSLYRYEEGRWEAVLEGMSIPNGIAFAPDDRTMYYIDTPTRRIDSYRFDPETGTLSGKRTAVRIERDGNPDGMTIDCEGMLWVALWGGCGVGRYDPETGALLEFVSVPDRNVSCCTFGGADMDVLYITTAMDEEGQGGYLYEWKAGVKGAAPYRFCRASQQQVPGGGRER